MEKVCIETVVVENERVSGVKTDNGEEIRCEVFVNCGGQASVVQGSFKLLL